MNKEIYLILDNIRSKENVGSIFRTADAAGVSKIYLCGITPRPEEKSESSYKGFNLLDRFTNDETHMNNKNVTFKNFDKNEVQDLNRDTRFFKDNKISKAALGAERWVPWEYHKQTWRLLENFEKNSKFKKLSIVILENLSSSQKTKLGIEPRNIFSIKPSYPVVLVIGNEVNGVSESAIKRADYVLYIPMFGRKESLNVAVAAGIALYAFR